MATLQKLLVKQAAWLFGVDRRTIGRWVKDEGFPKNDDGTIDGQAAVGWFSEHLEAKLMERFTGPAPGGEWLEEYRKFAAKRQELAFKKEAGELIPVEECQRQAAGVIAELSSAFDNLPARLRAQLRGITDEVEVERVVNLELYILRAILARGERYSDQAADAAADGLGGLTPKMRNQNAIHNQLFGKNYWNPQAKNRAAEAKGEKDDDEKN